jgi:FMN reductase (NADPH)
MANENLNADADIVTTSETIEVLHNRVSVRAFKPDPVPEAQIEAVLRAALRAPTSSNIQAYSVVVVRDAESRRLLSVAAGNQAHVADAPVFLAFCADLTRIEGAMHRHGHSLDDNNLELGLVSTIDAALVGMSAYLAADSLGLKGVMIGGVRNDPAEVARVLDLPHRVYCVFGMCLGWPSSTPGQKPRMDYDAVVHSERYRRDGLDRALDAYDAALAAYYRQTGKPTATNSWTAEIGKKFGRPQRDDLRRALGEMGFDFR